MARRYDQPYRRSSGGGDKDDDSNDYRRPRQNRLIATLTTAAAAIDDTAAAYDDRYQASGDTNHLYDLLDETMERLQHCSNSDLFSHRRNIVDKLAFWNDRFRRQLQAVRRKMSYWQDVVDMEEGRRQSNNLKRHYRHYRPNVPPPDPPSRQRRESSQEASQSRRRVEEKTTTMRPLANGDHVEPKAADEEAAAKAITACSSPIVTVEAYNEDDEDMWSAT